jgi:predicted dehydrogenase
LRQALQRGDIGAPVSLRSQLGQWLPDWHPDEDYRLGPSAKRESGGGVVLDLSHEIDLAVDLMGDVDAVSAVCGKFSNLEIETEDVAEITLIHKQRAISHIHLDYCQRTLAKTLQIIGEQGTLVWDYPANRVILQHPKGSDEVWSAPAGFERDNMFRAQLEHWLAVLAGEQQSRVPLAQGVLITKLAIAAKESSATKRQVSIQ